MPEKPGRIKGGYYIKARCLRDSWIAHSAPVVRETWDYLLREANHKERKYTGHIIKRGQLFRSFRDIREGLFWMVGNSKRKYSVDQVKHTMKLLVNNHMIALAKTPRGCVITICKYEYYQNPKNYESTNAAPVNPPTHPFPIPSLSPAINKNVKELKNEKKEPKTLMLEVQEIFDCWNSLVGPVTHRSITEFKSCINARLKDYSKSEIMESMGNYGKILQSMDHYWSHKYSLNDFLERKSNNIDRFADRNNPFENFLLDNSKATNPTQLDPYVRVEDM